MHQSRDHLHAQASEVFAQEVVRRNFISCGFYVSAPPLPQMSRQFLLPQDQHLKFYVGFVAQNNEVRLQTTFDLGQNYTELLSNCVSRFKTQIREDPAYSEENQALRD